MIMICAHANKIAYQKLIENWEPFKTIHTRYILTIKIQPIL